MLIRILLLSLLMALALLPGQTLLLDTKVTGRSLVLPPMVAGQTYTLTVSAAALANAVTIALKDDMGWITGKTLHAGDLDLTTAFRVRTPGAPRLELSIVAPLSVRVTSWGVTQTLEAEPNNRREQANPLRLGQTVYGSGDDAPYLPLPGTASVEIKKATLEQGQDWFRLDFTETRPKLVYFQLDLPERDQIPADISVFLLKDRAELVPYAEGEDPVTFPHEVQALNGNKFTTRIFRQPGTYYVRVVANHPEYRLKTRVYDLPPYQDPRQAVRTAVDFLLGAGDSWHANTPRRGGVYERVSAAHQETSLCVACHVTHFSLRAQLYANRKGYAVNQRDQLQFLTERFYNNPRPLYGFEEQGAVWSRVISAPANVLGRMSHLLDLYEKQITKERREKYHSGVREYLKLYYQDRTKLPANETNGNQPLVSAYEVAWYAWEVTQDPKIGALVAQNEIKDMIDLCYQTQALAAIDKEKYADQIKANAFRILSLQRPSGQWSMKFAATEKEVEFQTGHALWALNAAGIPLEHPQIQKGLGYLLGRQQEFGGWLDPLQSFENFRTPFRETQMAVLALSSYYPENPRREAAADPGKMSPLDLLNQIWTLTSAAQAKELEKEALSADPFVRQQAVEVLGRLAHAASMPVLIARLGDESKRVQRTAAWAVRQIESRRGVNAAPVVAALGSTNPRLRWGASRIFSQHFAALADTPEFAAALEQRLTDASPTIRNQAAKGLWQFWFWTPRAALKDRIENALLAALAVPQHPWAETALREGVYNLADENIRYLYNNWVPLISHKEDQDRVIRGRLALEDRLSKKFSQFLATQSDTNRKRLLAGLVELPLRRGDVYDPKADLSHGFQPLYQRIGNDIEQSVFFGEANTRFAAALAPLLESQDAELRRLAIGAAQLTRDARLGAVTAIAGQPGPARDALVAVAKKDPAVVENRELLRAFNALPRPAAAAGSGARRMAAARPDESFYRGYVEPIFNKRGADGQACAHCHSSHSIFNATYSTVFNVVNLEDPEKSLLLVKPTSNAETEGTLNARSHGGGVRFEKDSPEYNTILNWLRGAKE